MTSANDFLSEDVPDSTDFPPQTRAPGLRKLDMVFRCTICGETYDAPVTLPCGHSFCSGCLRPTMAIKQECPSCRKVANEGHIRPNHAIEDAIAAWNECRPYILGLIKQEESLESHTQTSRKRKRSRESNPTPPIPGPSRIDDEASSQPPSNNSKYFSKSRKQTTLDQEEDLIILSSDVEAYQMPGMNPRPDESVNCPLCSKRIQFKRLNSHIDRGCEDPPSEEASVMWSKILKPKSVARKGKHKKECSESDSDYPLPKVSYSTLKEKQIRDLLQEHNLSIQGDRSQLERRHQRWVMIYNTNLDRSIQNRKNKAALRQELKKWEESMSKKKVLVVHDAKQHAKLYKSEFDRLVKVVQQNMNRSTSHVMSSMSPDPTSSGRQAPHLSSPPKDHYNRYTSRPDAEPAAIVDPEEGVEAMNTDIHQI